MHHAAAVRNLNDELLQDGIGDGRKGGGGDNQATGAADRVVAKEHLEVGLDRQHRQAVDAGAGPHRIVARLGCGTTPLLRPSPETSITHRPPLKRPEQGQRTIDGPADRGAAPSWRGAAAMATAKRSIEAASLTVPA